MGVSTCFGDEIGFFGPFEMFILREFVVTTVILTPGTGNPGSVLGVLTPFPADLTRFDWIRRRIPGASRNVMKTIKIEHFTGKMDDAFY